MLVLRKPYTNANKQTKNQQIFRIINAINFCGKNFYQEFASF